MRADERNNGVREDLAETPIPPRHHEPTSPKRAVANDCERAIPKRRYNWGSPESIDPGRPDLIVLEAERLRPSYPKAVAARLQYELTAYDAWYKGKAVRLERPFGYHNHHRNERAFVRSLVAKYHIARGSSLIDLGCGNGFYASAFSSHGLRVTAVDVSGIVVDHAKRKYGERVEWIVDDAFKLPFHEEFDYGFCHYLTFFNAADVPAAFAEYGRAMMGYYDRAERSSLSGTAISPLSGFRPIASASCDTRSDSSRGFFRITA